MCRVGPLPGVPGKWGHWLRAELELASLGRQAGAGLVHPDQADDLILMAMTSVTQTPGEQTGQTTHAGHLQF